MQPHRRTSKMQLFGNGDEITQMPNLNIVHIEIISIVMNKILDVSPCIALRFFYDGRY